MRSFGGILLALILVGLGAVYLKFGTIEPCGIVRAQVREAAVREGGLASVAAVLPDSVLDGLIAVASKAPLTPSRCIALLLNPPNIQAPAQSMTTYVPPASPQVPQPQTAPQALPSPSAWPITRTPREAIQAINACKDRRLRGELTHAQSAICSRPGIIQAYARAGYRYMDLVALIATKRVELGQQLDQRVITEAEADQKIKEFVASMVEREHQRDAERR